MCVTYIIQKNYFKIRTFNVQGLYAVVPSTRPCPEVFLRQDSRRYKLNTFIRYRNNQTLAKALKSIESVKESQLGAFCP